MKTVRALVMIGEYRRWKDAGTKAPIFWCAWASGPDVEIVEESDVSNGMMMIAPFTYVRCKFEVDEETLSPKMLDRLKFYGGLLLAAALLTSCVHCWHPRHRPRCCHEVLR